jgi:hypothetical protein
MATELRQEELQLVLAIDDAPTRLDEFLAMARYDASIGRPAAAHTLLSMAMDAARDIPPTASGASLERLLATAIDLREIDLARAVLRAQAAAVDKLPTLAGRVAGKLLMAGLQAKAGMAADARNSLIDGFRLAKQLSDYRNPSNVDSLFLPLALAHSGDGVGALQALDVANGTVLYAASRGAEVLAEIAVDRWRAGEAEVALRALAWAESALDATPWESSLEPSLEISFARGLVGDTRIAVEHLRRAMQIADAMARPEDRAATLLRVAQFAAAVETNHFDPLQPGLEGWKVLGE